MNIYFHISGTISVYMRPVLSVFIWIKKSACLKASLTQVAERREKGNVSHIKAFKYLMALKMLSTNTLVKFKDLEFRNPDQTSS